MTRSNDLLRLDNIAQKIGDRCSKDFQGAVDVSAGVMASLGIHKLFLMAKDDDDQLLVCRYVAEWLSTKFPGNLVRTSQVIAARGHDKRELKQEDIIRAALRDILAIDGMTAWRSIDDEAINYLTQMKIYAKAVNVDDK